MHKLYSKLKKVRKVVRGTVHVTLMQSCQNYSENGSESNSGSNQATETSVEHLRMIHCLQYDGQQANNADADKNHHIFAHCLNNEIWVETNEGQRTEGYRHRVMMKQTPCLAAH